MKLTDKFSGVKVFDIINRYNYPVADWLFSREYINEMIKKYSIQTRENHD